MFFRSDVSGAGVLMHALCLFDNNKHLIVASCWFFHSFPDYNFTVAPFRAIRRYFKTLRTPGSKVLPDMLLVLLVVGCG